MRSNAIGAATQVFFLQGKLPIIATTSKGTTTHSLQRA
jgi:hypothetical protein